MAGRSYPGVALNAITEKAVRDALGVIDLWIRDQRPAAAATSANGLVGPTYVVVSADPTLLNERVLAVSSPLTLSDAGAGSTIRVGFSSALLGAIPTITYATTFGAGAATTFVRTDAQLKYPTAIMSAANASTLTLTDDGTDMTLTGSTGSVNIRPSAETLSLPKWTGGGATAPTVGTVLGFVGRTSVTLDSSLDHAVKSDVTWDDSGGSYTSATHYGIRSTVRHASGPTYTSMTLIAMQGQIVPQNFTSGTHTWTERTACNLLAGAATKSSTGVVTTTDTHGVRVSGYPTLGGGLFTNARSARFQLPTIGGTIRRGCEVDPSSTANVGTEAANVEGYYCGALPRGTAQRASFYAEGATTGTPTMVASFYAAAHSVGTTKWSFYANNESRMVGVQQDDSAKSVFGTGRDAEIYYDGTDLVCDPDVVGTGVLDLRGGFKVDSITNDTGLAHGVFTPTRSAEANMDANVTMTEGQYMRVGNTVTMSGRFTADPTLTATTTSFEMTLPIASNIGAAEDLAGIAFCGNIAAQGAEITGSVANNTAIVSWKAADVTSQTWSYAYSYQVI